MNREFLRPWFQNELVRIVKDQDAASRYMINSAGHKMNFDERKALAESARGMNRLLNEVAEYDEKGNLTGILRHQWDDFCEHGPAPRNAPMNANVMQPALLRQIIMLEVMRAFRRRLIALSFFAHTFQDVPMYSGGGGSDFVEVPYFPLYTNTSQQFSYAAGYPTTNVLGGNSQTLSKQIQVGGAGGITNTGNAAGTTGTTVPAATPPTGGGRLFQTLLFTAYEIARQPWLNTSPLAIMAGEQLALDIWNTIISANVTYANFGPAVYSGPYQQFDDTTLAELEITANQLDWPTVGRACVLSNLYYGNLLVDPFLKSYLNIGSTDPIRKAELGYGYSFRLAQSPRLPTAADGSTFGGWICLPSAVIVATANIIPGPGAAKQSMINLVVDDQTGLSFLHTRFGSPQYDSDAEIIECSFGSAPGELAALKRIVSAGA